MARTLACAALWAVVGVGLPLAAPGCASTAPLPSWNATPRAATIHDFVRKVTDPSRPEYVPPEQRIAVFDNDGTLWAEQPQYVQLYFAFDRIKALAPAHPGWKDTEPYKSALAGDVRGVLAGGDAALMEVFAVSHAGQTTEEFEREVKAWIRTARHPQTGCLFTQMVYQPMLELLAYLRANGFKTYIVSGGGVDFMRPWTEAVYGIPPEQVIGSSFKTAFEIRAGTPVLVKLPVVSSVDDKQGKPINIELHIGRRPIAAFGNSDGDLQMLQWTAAGTGAHLCVLVHHTDAAREWAYDRASTVGRLDAALDEATLRHWTVVNMKDDWAQVFPPAR